MRILRSTSKWYQHLWAALIFLTRLPFWRVYQPPKESYRAVVEFWPLTGWLHEDGLADFLDGFGGGGHDRERILAIMKDSRIGTYGVLGLTFYFLLLFLALYHLPPATAALTVIAADPFSKMLAGQVVQMMPYARTEAEAKNKVVYRKVSIAGSIALAFQGLLPILPLLFFTDILSAQWHLVVFIPCLVMYFLYLKIWTKLRGYTGDCCGAMFLLVELSVYLTVCAIVYRSTLAA